MGVPSLQEHHRPQNQSLSQRLREIQALQSQEGQESRNWQGLLRPQESCQGINGLRDIYVLLLKIVGFYTSVVLLVDADISLGGEVLLKMYRQKFTLPTFLF